MGLTKQQLEALNVSSFPNNNTGYITPDILRQYNAATITNTVNQDTYTTDSASFDNRIDNIIDGTAYLSTASFNTYTSSNDSKVNSLIAETASYATAAITASSLITASVSQSTITFTKGDGSQFNIVVADVSGGASINTGSFATTGSNTFNGNQTITGSVTISGSATSDLTVVGQIFVSSSATSGGNALPKITVSGSAGQSIINRNFISTRNTTNSAGIYPSTIYTGDISTADEIGFTVDPSVFGITGWSTGPAIYVNNDAGNTFPAVFGFQNKANYTDGRVAVLTPLSASAGFTASLQDGYAWVGNSLGQNTQVATSSFVGTPIDTGSFATTGSNYFTGQQTLSDVDRLNQLTLDDHSGSLVLYSKGFTSSSLAHITANSAGVGNIIFKTNNNTSTTIVSGSNNLFVNAGTPTTGFTRYIGGSGNIMLGQANVPQISSSMTISPTMNNNYFGGNNTTLTMRGPISSSAWTISANNVIGTINIGSSAGGNAQGIQSGLTMTANTIAGTLNIVASQNTLSSSVSFTNNILNGTAAINAGSSSVSFLFNNINDNSFTLNNNYFSSSAGVGSIAFNRNNIGGQSQTISIQGSLPVGTTNTPSLSDNAIFGGSNILFSDVSSARVVSTNAYHSGIRNVIGGNGLIVSASSLLADTTSFGSAYFGRWNANDGIRNKTSDIVFAVGTGTSTTRKTGFLIDSGSNTFVEGTFNVSGSTSFTGSVTIQSGSSFFANGNKQFNVGAFQSGVSQSGSANVSQSMNFETTDISDGVTMVDNSKITFANSGTYNIQFSAQIDRISGSGIDDVYIWLKKNGVNVANTTGQITVSGGANEAKTIQSWNYVVETTNSDYWELVWQSTDSNIHLSTFTPGGNIPNVPSIILTVTQVR